jgi:tetratricopeptide (TPR) repeat protein
MPEVASLADPFTVQATLATDVAKALDVKLDAREKSAISARGTSDTAAFSAFTLGNRLTRQGAGQTLAVYQQVLQKYERAYQVDHRYADALGAAAAVFMRMGRVAIHPAYFDSAAVLARQALARAPGNARALTATAGVALAHDRPDDAQKLVERAIAANPSDVEALQLHAELLLFVGDSAGTWRDIEHLVALAPQSSNALVVAATSAQALRRFGDANEFLRRARVLEPDRTDLILRSAILDRTDADFDQMTRAVREFRAHGGHLSAADLTLLRAGDDSMQQELATASPVAYGVATRADSFNYYTQKAQLFLARRDTVRSRALLDSSATTLRLLLADPTVLPSQQRKYGELMAWTDAALGNRARALAAVTSVERTPIAQQWPDGEFAAVTACNGAEIYAFLDDVDQMLVQLRRCFTLPGGYAAKAISAEPALWRHAPDPRLRALLSDFNLNIKHVE